MKVLMCAPDQRGGVLFFCRMIGQELPDTVDIFFLGRRENNKSRSSNIARMYRDYYRFTKYLLQHRCDIVHLNPSLDFKAIVRDGIFLLISKVFRKKAVVFIHGWTYRFEDKLRKYGRLFFTPAYNTADTIVVLYSGFRARLVEMGIRKNIHILTTVVSDEVIRGTENALMTAKDSETTGCVTILFLSRIEKGKGIYETIDAFRILRTRISNLKLIVAGDGSELAAVKEYVRDNHVDGISFLGWVQQEGKVQPLLQSDIYILPTIHGEGIAISILEAMAAGLPVISRPLGGIIDFFEDGKMGLLVESPDPADIARALEQLIIDKDLRLRIGKYNHQYARKHFLASIGARKLEQIYEEVLHG